MRIDRLKGLESLNTSTNVNQVPMVVHIHEQHPMVIEDGKDRTSKGRDWQQHHLIHPWPMLFALPQALPQVFRHQQEASDHREPGPVLFFQPGFACMVKQLEIMGASRTVRNVHPMFGRSR
jgi:hypothetical protein